MTPETFQALLKPITDYIGARTLDNTLESDLNAQFPPESQAFKDIRAACDAAVDAGWMCAREAGGIKFGRVIKPGGDLGAFSVDVVEMDDVRGPHHRHPNGEIDLIMPLRGDARFDGHGAGWLVYEAGSAHFPTVSGGAALVLYLLPEGAIEFTKT